MISRLIKTHKIYTCHCGRALHDEMVTTFDYSYLTCRNRFKYSKCICGTFVLINRPDQSELATIYPDAYDAYSPSSDLIVRFLRDINFRRKFKIARRRIAAKTWIDYGSGAGEFAQVLKKMGVGEVYALDFAYKRSEVLASGVKQLNENQIDQIDDNSVDVISMLQVIEHLGNPEKVLEKLSKKLVVGGLILIETPSPSGLDFMLGRNGIWGGWHAPRHFYVFQDIAIKAMLENNGFKVVKHSYIPSPYLWSQTLKARRHGFTSVGTNGFWSIRNPAAIAVLACIDFLSLTLFMKTSNQRIVAIKKLNYED